jgi:hypothetical protein
LLLLLLDIWRNANSLVLVLVLNSRRRGGALGMKWYGLCEESSQHPWLRGVASNQLCCGSACVVVFVAADGDGDVDVVTVVESAIVGCF